RARKRLIRGGCDGEDALHGDRALQERRRRAHLPPLPRQGADDASRRGVRGELGDARAHALLSAHGGREPCRPGRVGEELDGPRRLRGASRDHVEGRGRAHRAEALSHDPEARLREVPALLAPQGSEDRQTEEPGDVRHARSGGAPRARHPVLQAPLRGRPCPPESPRSATCSSAITSTPVIWRRCSPSTSPRAPTWTATAACWWGTTPYAPTSRGCSRCGRESTARGRRWCRPARASPWSTATGA